MYVPRSSSMDVDWRRRPVDEWPALVRYLLENGDGHGPSTPRTDAMAAALNDMVASLPTAALVRALDATVTGTSDPVARDAAHRALYAHLARQSALPPGDLFEMVRPLVVAGLTDVWSATRKHCAHALPLLLDRCTDPAQIRTLFHDLVAAATTGRTWQAVQGAAGAINALVRSFQWQIAPDATNRLHLAVGAMTFDAMPAFIRDALPPTMYRLMGHAQTTVRETAIRALAAYLSRAPAAATEAALATTMRGLGESRDDAFRTEGLLGFAVEVVSRLPPAYLLSTWATYFDTVQAMLGHRASTVRQMASRVFLALVARHRDAHVADRAVLVGHVMQSLASGWARAPGVVEPAPGADHHPAMPTTTAPASMFPPVDRPAAASANWESKEGHLLAYELIVVVLSAAMDHDAPCRPAAGRPHRGSVVALAGRPLQRRCSHHQHQQDAPERLRSQSLPNLAMSDQEETSHLLSYLESAGSSSAGDACAGRPPLGRTCTDCQSEYFPADAIARPSLVLRAWLLQCVASAVDGRWELRRMADQVSPAIVRLLVHLRPTIADDLLRSATDRVGRLAACLVARHHGRAAPDTTMLRQWVSSSPGADDPLLAAALDALVSNAAVEGDVDAVVAGCGRVPGRYASWLLPRIWSAMGALVGRCRDARLISAVVDLAVRCDNAATRNGAVLAIRDMVDSMGDDHVMLAAVVTGACALLIATGDVDVKAVLDVMHCAASRTQALDGIRYEVDLLTPGQGRRASTTPSALGRPAAPGHRRKAPSLDSGTALSRSSSDGDVAGDAGDDWDDWDSDSDAGDDHLEKVADAGDLDRADLLNAVQRLQVKVADVLRLLLPADDVIAPDHVI